VSRDPYFIEQRDDGKYAVKRANADWASEIFETQDAAIRRARELTEGPIHVERVRNTSIGSPDKWRGI
jgi:uncharacterized protein YdaT